jgi:hypothetical protein
MPDADWQRKFEADRDLQRWLKTMGDEINEPPSTEICCAVKALPPGRILQDDDDYYARVEDVPAILARNNRFIVVMPPYNGVQRLCVRPGA